jgi:hypothetical protein
VQAMNKEISNNNNPGNFDVTDSDTFDVNAVLNIDTINADTFIGEGDAVDVLAETFIEDALSEGDALESSIDL